MSVEFRSVVHHNYLLKKGPTEIHNLIIEAYGDAAPTLSFVNKWLGLFRDGRIKLDDLPRSGRPVDQKNIEIVQKYIEDYLFNSACVISSSTGLSINTVITILTDVLKRKKRHAKWVPHCLMNQQKEKRRLLSKTLFFTFEGLSDYKMSHEITRDESWFYLNYYSDDAYLKDGESIEIPKRMISNQKILVFSAFSSEGLVLLEMMPIGKKFNSDYMCNTILLKLWKNAQSQFNITENSHISIHMDNAKPHNSHKTIEKLSKLKMIRLHQPAYSPDLSPKDFFLYGFVKNKLK